MASSVKRHMTNVCNNHINPCRSGLSRGWYLPGWVLRVVRLLPPRLQQLLVPPEVLLTSHRSGRASMLPNASEIHDWEGHACVWILQGCRL